MGSTDAVTFFIFQKSEERGFRFWYIYYTIRLDSWDMLIIVEVQLFGWILYICRSSSYRYYMGNLNEYYNYYPGTRYRLSGYTFLITRYGTRYGTVLVDGLNIHFNFKFVLSLGSAYKKGVHSCLDFRVGHRTCVQG